jgi:hypothetical protein
LLLVSTLVLGRHARRSECCEDCLPRTRQGPLGTLPGELERSIVDDG